MSSTAKPADEELSLYDIAVYVERYARRWAVGQSPNPEDAVIYDGCLKIINEAFAPQYLGKGPGAPSAQRDRYSRYGHEPITNSFTIPVTVEDALVILHRYARRYTNGRGLYTAILANSAAEHLLARGISLDETRRLDGSIWATDGEGGDNDGLDEERRAEAIASLPHHEPASSED